MESLTAYCGLITPGISVIYSVYYRRHYHKFMSGTGILFALVIIDGYQVYPLNHYTYKATVTST